MPSDSRASAPSKKGRILRGLVFFLAVFVLLPWVVSEFGPFAPGGAWIAQFRVGVIFGLWGVILLVRAVRRFRRERKGAVAFNFAVLFLGLMVVEFILGQGVPNMKYHTIQPEPGTYHRKDPDLGYAPQPNRESRFKAMAGGETVYDITYTTEDDALRLRPPLRTPPPEGSVLFFGCSYTWGSGLDDEETYPYKVEQRLDGRLRCYNFGFAGFGPHQMLANLEIGRVDKVVEYPPRYAFYLALLDHPIRCAGEMMHDRHGPWYKMTDDGRVERGGQFSDDKARLYKLRLQRLLGHAHLGRSLVQKMNASVTGSMEHFTAIVATSRDEILKRWPDCQFYAMVWDDRGWADAMVESLEAAEVKTLRISDMLPELKENPQAYRIHNYEHHPGSKATELISEFLVERVIE